MIDKQVFQNAKVYYRDYADDLDLMKTWSELTEEQKRAWYDYAARRIERDS